MGPALNMDDREHITSCWLSRACQPRKVTWQRPRQRVCTLGWPQLCCPPICVPWTNQLPSTQDREKELASCSSKTPRCSRVQGLPDSFQLWCSRQPAKESETISGRVSTKGVLSRHEASQRSVDYVVTPFSRTATTSTLTPK